MGEPMYSITYFSRSNLTGNAEEIRNNVLQILDVAQSRNSQNDVTGALLYSGGYFIQVLEGPLTNLESIFESIQCDRRHRDVSVLHYNRIDHRTFSQWSMALAGIQNGIDPALKAMLAKPEDISATSAGHELVDTLVSLISRYQSSQA